MTFFLTDPFQATDGKQLQEEIFNLIIVSPIIKAMPSLRNAIRAVFYSYYTAESCVVSYICPSEECHWDVFLADKVRGALII